MPWSNRAAKRAILVPADPFGDFSRPRAALVGLVERDRLRGLIRLVASLAADLERADGAHASRRSAAPVGARRATAVRSTRAADRETAVTDFVRTADPAGTRVPGLETIAVQGFLCARRHA